MTDALLTRHTQERAAKVQLISNYANTAAEEGRDLSDTEQETITHARARIADLDKQIGLLADDLSMADSVRDRLRLVDPAVGGRDVQYRSAGQLLYDVLHQSDDDSRTRYHRAMKRAAEHMGTLAANTIATAGDLGGLVVTPNVGPVIDPFPGGMPFAMALGLIDAPNAMHFMRPRIVDPDFADGVAVQAKEKAELASKKFDVAADPIALATVGGYLNVSQQLISLQPGSLDIIIGHMNKRLANSIDLSLITELAKSTGKVALAAGADGAAILKAFYAASAAVFTSTGELATWVAMGPLGWARLGSLVDLAGRPLFPFLGAANANGTAAANTFAMNGPAGLTPVVTPAIVDDSFWVGNSASMEGYIYRFPVLEAVEPSVLGRQVAVAAAVAGHRAVANAAVHLAP